MPTLDLNADLGEGFGPWRMGDDAAMLDIVSTANIACGFHAGDPAIMRATVLAARDRGVAVGAHPGYADLAGFGRRPMAGVTAAEVETLVAYQVGAFAGICALAGHPATHVKTHGALGNACADDDDLAAAVARAIRAVDPSLAFMVMPGTATARAAEAAGLRPINEIYADRTYAPGFNLTPRSRPDAMIHDPAEALARILEAVGTGRLTATDGSTLDVAIDSVCVHGDSPNAVAMAAALRDGLAAAGYAIRPAAPGRT
ncbi:5-oxoprolinase subunit PxpA [Rhodobacterales bacterium HKCCE2091]|nr:5-oxoprolinase subunit PxpA [Rhodobacterales bacterium HKCCE2091]